MVHTSKQNVLYLLILLQTHVVVTIASMNPLMVSRTALLRSIRKVNTPAATSDDRISTSHSTLYSPTIDEWYDNGCDELLQTSDNGNQNGEEVILCNVSREKTKESW